MTIEVEDLKIDGVDCKRKYGELKGFVLPTDKVPYWLFSFENGIEIFASGRITLVTKEKLRGSVGSNSGSREPKSYYWSALSKG